MRHLLVLGAVVLLTSCTTYRRGFDCPPSRGVPCASVTEIESMIVETREGSDFLASDERDFSRSQPRHLPVGVSECLGHNDQDVTVWIAPSREAEGHLIGAHYAQLNVPWGQPHA